MRSDDEGLPALIIRTFRGADVDALRGLIVEMQNHERSFDPRLLEGSQMAVAYGEAMLARLEAEDGEVFVAEVDGKVVGFVTVLAAVTSLELDQPPGSYALISDLSVSAPYRFRGIGRALLDAAVGYARARGAADLRIAVLADNVRAGRLYRSYGFRPYLQIHMMEL
jgi:ribosomal protein S18 acetylase RimI-like enzyme